MDIDKLADQHHIDIVYLKKLGFALYAFSSAESHAIWCCDRLQHGFHSTWTSKDWAQAKKLAQKLQHLAGIAVKLKPGQEYKANLKELTEYAGKFYGLAEDGRNNLLHALPIGYNGNTILSNLRERVIFRESELEKFISTSLECRAYFNKAMHGYLQEHIE